MNLYFSPLACSLATRIALYEAGAKADFTKVDTKAKRTADGGDFLEINPMGQVPTLRTDEGAVITENTAVLQYVAERYPEAALVPETPVARAQLRQWLGFIATELHKAVFGPLFDAKASDAVKAYARDLVPLRLAVLQRHLDGREFLLDRFSVADAYLVTVLNWTRAVGIDLKAWPAVLDYYQRLGKRPSVLRATGEEFQLYQAAQAQPRAATA